MDAAVFVAAGCALEVRQYPAPVAAPGEAVVELALSGVCGTDVHIWEGAIPFSGPIILGHEFLGRVSDLGAGEHRDCMGRPVAVGDLVAVNVIEPCGECLLCRTGGAASCLNLAATLTYTRSVDEPPHLHGGYAEATVCPARYLHVLPRALAPDVAGAFLCAGPTIVRALEYAGAPGHHEHVVVQGSGPVGLFAALYCSRLPAASVTLIGSSSNARRLELAAELGATSVLDIRSTSVDERRDAILARTEGRGADLVIECSGSPEAVPEGLALLRPRGRYALAGQYSDRGLVGVPTHTITFQALQVFGSAQFTASDREAYWRFLELERDLWPVITSVITHRFPVREADRAVRAVHSGEAVRAVLVPDSANKVSA